ncbi:MAG: 50S ribosomal protein L6 [Bacteriovoracaceae bacterium]|jgi:large subunit ribosomal protein L6|nr:50S ribosomal protein L6 [Bacteriovoracaceae bacterium]
MSRIGKKPVAVPEKVTVAIADRKIDVKGPKGSLTFTHHTGVTVKQEGAELIVNPIDGSNKNRALWGLTRTLVSNMVTGVTDGFKRTLEFNGVGYKAVVSGNKITLNLGYSHPIEYALPEGVEAKVTKNVIDITGCDKELVGFVAAKIRSFREPEPYKGKGVKYSDEVIIRKAGKTGKK